MREDQQDSEACSWSYLEEHGLTRWLRRSRPDEWSYLDHPEHLNPFNVEDWTDLSRMGKEGQDSQDHLNHQILVHPEPLDPDFNQIIQITLIPDTEPPTSGSPGSSRSPRLGFLDKATQTT